MANDNVCVTTDVTDLRVAVRSPKAWEKNASITPDVLFTKAHQLKIEFGVENFNPNDGWSTK